MKNLFAYIIASTLGGCIVLAGFYILDGNAQIPQEENITPRYASAVSPASMSVDFVKASALATEAVVHIYAEESNALAQQRAQEGKKNRRMSPFEDFFGMDDFFGGDLYGRNFYRPKNGTGSGVIISNDGYIVTNNHVVGFADFIEVTLEDGRKLQATRVGTDPSTDLAVIKIKESNLATLKYADSDRVRVGEWAIAVGNPFNLASTVTAGIISAKGRDLNLIKEKGSIEEFIQTDAAVNPGNSGGALVNVDGELIGINTAIATPTGVYAGYSFAIPSNLVRKIVKEIIEEGNIDRKVSLGIGGYNMDEDLMKKYNLSVSEGIYVEEIERGSAAQYGGLLQGDIIVKVNDRKVENFDRLKEAMKFTKVGDTVSVVVVRNGKQKTIPVKLLRKM